MKAILAYIKDFLAEDFQLWRYSISLLLLAGLFYLFYSGTLLSFFTISNQADVDFFYLVFLSSLCIIFYSVSFGKPTLKKLLFLLFVIAALYFNHISKSFGDDLFQAWELDNRLSEWFTDLFVNFQKCIALCLPLLIAYGFQRKQLDTFYGFSTKGFSARPYVIMLAFMLPLIVIAGFSDSFLRTYPRYRPGIAEEAGLISEWLSVGLFELTYVLRFIGVEAFFRGLLVIGGVAVFGRKAILPAACIYSAWHFGKPMGEAIGAFFGGYILGIIAMRTKSILGGIAIHYGVAILMELAAWNALIWRGLI